MCISPEILALYQNRAHIWNPWVMALLVMCISHTFDNVTIFVNFQNSKNREIDRNSGTGGGMASFDTLPDTATCGCSDGMRHLSGARKPWEEFASQNPTFDGCFFKTLTPWRRAPR